MSGAREKAISKIQNIKMQALKDYRSCREVGINIKTACQIVTDLYKKYKIKE